MDISSLHMKPKRMQLRTSLYLCLSLSLPKQQSLPASLLCSVFGLSSLLLSFFFFIHKNKSWPHSFSCHYCKRLHGYCRFLFWLLQLRFPHSFKIKTLIQETRPEGCFTHTYTRTSGSTTTTGARGRQVNSSIRTSAAGLGDNNNNHANIHTHPIHAFGNADSRLHFLDKKEAAGGR